MPVLGFDGAWGGVVKTVKGYGGSPVFIEEAFEEIPTIVGLVEFGFDVGGID